MVIFVMKIRIKIYYGMTNPEISAINGKFDKNMCPLHLMVGASELLLDDSINVAEKAYNNGVNVRLDISPFLFHTWPIFANFYDEAVFAIVKSAQFINKHVV